MKIVFMGTPDIAATCLKQVLAAGFEVAAVFTKPDTPKKRGMKLLPSPVKEVAVAHDIPVYQPETFKDDAAVEALRAIAPDVIAVVAYGKILPQRVLDIPAKGCINIHTSLLPQFRGSAPCQWAVLSGLPETGVSAQYMVWELDAGDVIGVRKTPIGENESSGQLLERLAALGGELLCETLAKVENGTAVGTPQDPSQVTFAPMLSKDMSPIDWNKTPWEISCQVRGLDPWPVATMELKGQTFKVYSVAPVEETTTKAPGTVLGVSKTGLRVACADGTVLEVRQLQAPGGKRMAAPDYFRGHPL